jgi:tripartite-type tricarboxylate transporter receptor subunit TctC
LGRAIGFQIGSQWRNACPGTSGSNRSRSASMKPIGWIIATLAFAAMITGGVGHAESYPSRVIHLILPQPAGGAVDLIARSLAQNFSESLGRPVIVENMPGANGGIAAERVARSTPDGYTLMVAVDSNLVVNPSLYASLAYDPFRDFVPISIIAGLHMVLVANPDVPANTVGELIAYAKAHPNKLNYAGIGLGTSPHMGMELFKRITKTQINEVEYRGTSQAMADVLSHTVDVMLTGPPAAQALSKGGKLKLLAITGPSRLPQMPDVPTLAEAGVPGCEIESWFGLLAPANTPKPILDLLSREVKKAVAEPQFVGRMQTQGLNIIGSTPEQMTLRMKDDTKKWKTLIDDAGLKIEQ